MHFRLRSVCTNTYSIFNLFQENGKIKPSDELKEFLLAMFLTSSYCILYARNKLGVNNPDVPALEKSVMKKILDTCELKDSMNLSELTMKEIFNGQSELSYEAFKSLFNQNKEFSYYIDKIEKLNSITELENMIDNNEKIFIFNRLSNRTYCENRDIRS